MTHRLLLLTAAIVLAGHALSQEPVRSIEPDALLQQIENGAAPLILDVRTGREFRKGHVSGAINIPHDELAARLHELDATRSNTIVVYCHSGRRAVSAESILVEAGFTDVADLNGHWRDWPEKSDRGN